ncbi:MAG TPA: hypothetical protein VHE83_18290 [Mycobacteriales bacterium]|nr:hypothetical protein [Mycobacteriales bacterium]
MLNRARTGLALTVALCATVLPLALSGPAHAATQLECIGVVVDPAGSGSPRAPDTYCATVPYGATGQQVLAARAKALNRPQPRYQGGLLCAIDGYPATGCGEHDTARGGYDYWSYWHKRRGSSQWVYSGTGADQYSPVPGDLEGWAFQEGGAEGGRVPPDVSAESVCATARPAASGASSAPSSKKPSATTPATRPATKAPTKSATPTPAATKPSTSSPAPSVASTALITGRGPTTPPPSVDPSFTSHPPVTTTPAAGSSSPAVVAPAVADATPTKKGGGPPVGAIVAGIAVLLLAAGAFARSRMTRR